MQAKRRQPKQTSRAEVDTAHLPPYSSEITIKSLEQLHAEISAAGSLKPNTRYNFEGHMWITDNRGRPIYAGGRLRIKPHGRSGKSLQTKIGNEGDYAATDVGFHLIGDLFNGRVSRLNVVQGDGVLNNGEYKALENQFRRLLEEGHRVNATSRLTIKVEMIAHQGSRCISRLTEVTSKPGCFPIRLQLDG